MPLSTKFELYCDGEFYWWGRPEDSDKTIACHKSLTNSLSHNVVHLAQIEIRSHNISGDRN